jgi:Fic family protein
MREFDYSKLKDRLWNSEILIKVANIHEAKGRQELYLAQKPEELNRLVEIAKIQSTEASNAIEGIRTTDSRLKQLVTEKTTPRNRNEKEIAGYRDALSVIHDSFEYIPLTPNYILQLHSILCFHNDEVNYGGKYKNVQNYISATDENGNSFTLFTPLSPFETPMAMQNLCDEYNKAIEKRDVEPLVLIPVFIHDFLCIHPFNDGNGRMSRLLTTLLLYRSGYYVGKYISLEAKISKIKDLYYDALFESQKGWHEGNDDPTPFVKYLLSIIEMAYEDFEDRVKLISKKASAYELVDYAIKKKLGKVTKSDVAELCPSLSISAIEKAIAKMVDEGRLEKMGSGKTTYYVVKL